MKYLNIIFINIILLAFFYNCEAKKDIRDYNDADIEKIYEEWEKDEDPLEEDELPEWKRPSPKIDLTKIDPQNPESMLQMTKKGKTLMMFATVAGNPTEKESEEISKRWHTSLFNANYDLQRYVVGANRVLFVLQDGSTAWKVKDFLTTQDDCEVVTIESKDYPGNGAKKSKMSKDERNKSKTKNEKKTEL